jgi:hypothetical protein
MSQDAAAHDRWNTAINWYREIDNAPARFNVRLLESLRPEWEARVLPTVSMFRVLFTHDGSDSCMFNERVEVDFEAEDRVRVALSRTVPRRGENHPSGPVVVTGDHVRPENARLVVESFLMQLTTESQ